MSKPPQVPAVITGEVVTRAPTSAVAALPPLEALDDLTKELDAIVAMDGRAFKQFERLDAMRIPTSEAIEAAKATLAGLPSWQSARRRRTVNAGIFSRTKIDTTKTQDSGTRSSARE